jgi:hypothetical protein
MLETVSTIALIGLTAHPVQVEVSIRRGTPMIQIVGLAVGAARESRERIRSAASLLGLQHRRLICRYDPAECVNSRVRTVSKRNPILHFFDPVFDVVPSLMYAGARITASTPSSSACW